MSGLAIDLQHVEKTYGRRVRALRGIEMRVHRGEVFGLLGPNGAGKSTLVKILMTVISPSRCEGTVLGDPVGRKSTLARIGYLPEHHRFPPYLKGRQVVDFYGAMSGVPRAQRRSKCEELLELVGLTDWGNSKVGGYSKGMRQRLGIAQALINDPDLILLDEPTDGVDPVGRRDIRDMVARLKEQGHTIFINSHLLSELEMVCDRVAILVQGQVRSQGTIDDLTVDQRRYEVELAAEPSAAAAAFDAALPPDRRPAGSTVQGATLHIAGDDVGAVQPVIDALRAHGAVIRSIRPHRPSLEDLFMQAVTDETTGEVLRPGAAGGARGKHNQAPPIVPGQLGGER